MAFHRLILATVLFASFTQCFAAEKEFYGWFNVNPQFGVNLFYWGFQSRNNATTDPVVVWLTGGPGCSSSLALLFENGPYFVQPDLSLGTNPNSWNNNATVIFVDQPGGTGYSYVANSNGYVKNETQVADDMYSFLLQFFAEYPQFSKLPFFITGESYGGHYVTAISRRVQLGNQAGNAATINLQGLAIGNGWVDPLIQYQSYGEFAYSNNLISRGVYNEAQRIYTRCEREIGQSNWDAAFTTCSSIVDTVLSAAGNINPYDITKPCTVQPLCYNFSLIEQYLNLNTTKKRFGVAANFTWDECNTNVYVPLEADFVHSFREYLPFLLTSYRVFIYEGVNDFMCNYYGSTAYLASMPWTGQKGFAKAANTTWSVAGHPAGTVRTFENLTYITVSGAGHMVPHDQPLSGLEIVNNLIYGKPFTAAE